MSCSVDKPAGFNVTPGMPAQSGSARVVRGAHNCYAGMHVWQESEMTELSVSYRNDEIRWMKNNGKLCAMLFSQDFIRLNLSILCLLTLRIVLYWSSWVWVSEEQDMKGEPDNAVSEELWVKLQSDEFWSLMDHRTSQKPPYDLTETPLWEDGCVQSRQENTWRPPLCLTWSN